VTWWEKVQAVGRDLGWTAVRVINGLLDYDGPDGADEKRQRFWKRIHREWLATATITELSSWLDLRSRYEAPRHDRSWKYYRLR
jgi:hypothetical protein